MITDSQALLDTGQIIFGIIVIGRHRPRVRLLVQGVEPAPVPLEPHLSPRACPRSRSRSVSRTFPGVRGGAATAARSSPPSLRVADNDFICILGPSGCGKSTLLRIVAGLDRPTPGRVLLDGESVAGPGADRGMVFQSYTLFPWLTVEDNIGFGLREKGVRAEERRRDRRALRRAGRARAASSATIRRCSPAACSSERRWPARSPMTPKVLLLDEPFGALDNQTRALMQELLLGIWEARSQDGALRDPRHRGGDLHGQSRRRDDRPPGRIKSDVAVDLPHPRHYTMKTTARVLRLQGAAHRGDPGRVDPRRRDRRLRHHPPARRLDMGRGGP